jgi:hypothetical protein
MFYYQQRGYLSFWRKIHGGENSSQIKKLKGNMLRDKIDERIKERVNKLKSGKARKYFLTNIGYPKKQQAVDKYIVDSSIRVSEDLLPELLTLIKLIRPHFSKIWDQNNIVAAYLLLGKTFKILHSVLDEAKKGNPISIVELVRSGQEAIDLVFLFLDDKGGKYLEKWFKGKIVSNKEARKIIDKTINEMLAASTTEPVPTNKIKTDIYWTYSLYTHSGYGAMLDIIDVYHQDFDFEKFAGFHFTRQYLHLIQNLAVNLLLGMKNVFVYCKDLDGISRVDQQLGKFQQFFANPEEFIDIQNRYKQ